MKDIVIPNGTKSIGIYAFSNCKSLKEIAIPSAVESLVETNDGNMVEGINGKMQVLVLVLQAVHLWKR